MSNNIINPSLQGNLSIASSKDKQSSESCISLKRSVIDNFPHTKFSPLIRYSFKQLFFFEAIAMFVFVYGIVCYKQPNDAIIALSVFIAICISASLSGANVNPSITFSQCLRKQNKYHWKMIGVFLLAQILGTLLALALGKFLNDTQIPPFIPQNKDLTGFLRIIVSQAVGTFILIFFILLVTNPNTTFIQDQISGYLFIATFVHIGRKFAPASKQCINFAIALGSSIFSASDQDYDGLKYLFFWLAGQILGAIIATLFYDHFFEPNIQFLRKKKRESENFEYGDYKENKELNNESY